MSKLAKHRSLYLMLAIPLVYFLIFEYGPMFGVLMAFKDFNLIKGIWGSKWAGFKYFREYLTDPYFWNVFKNTIVLNVYALIFYFPTPIIFALLLHELMWKKFRSFVQTIAYIPHFLSTVVVAGMIVNFLSASGLINQIISRLGGEPIMFMMKAEWFRTIYIGSEIWQGMGWNSIIYLAALTAVDPQLYEAATIDGANRWRKLWHVTLPGISSVITVMLLMQIGKMMTVGFEKILLLYSGPTYKTADVIQTFVYRRGLIDSDFSFATAVGVFQSVIAFVLVISANQIAKKVNGHGLF